MKVKNIMFSGVMASILMIGGAYADNQTTAEPTQFTTTGLSTDSRLASAQYVKEGVAAAEDYAKTYANHMVHSLDATVSQSANTNGLSASVVEVDGKLDSVSVGVTAAEGVSANNTKLITSGVVYSGAKDALYDNNGVGNAARSIADVIAANESAIASLQTQASTESVGGQIDTKIADLDASVNSTSDTNSTVNITVVETDGMLASVSATLKADAVDSGQIKNGAVTTAKIADGNVTKAKLDSGVQASLDNADSAVQADDLADALKAAGVSGLEEGSYIDLTKDETSGKTTIAVTNIATSWNGGATPSSN